MAKELLTIEIGAKLIKVAISPKMRKDTQVKQVFCIPTPEDCVSDGTIVNHEKLRDVISEQFLHHSIIKPSGVIFAVNTSKTVSREITIPPVKGNRVEAMVQAMAPDNFPIDLTDYMLSYKVLEELKGETPGIRVLVTVVPKAVLMSYGPLATALGLPIREFDTVANSQLSLFTSQPSVGVTMYINIEEKQILTTFTNGKTLLLQRATPFGGEDLIKEIQTVSGLGDSDPERVMQLAKNPEWVAERMTSPEFAQNISRINNAITRNSDFFKSAYKGTAIDTVVLLGNCGEIVSIKDAVEGALGVPVRYLSEALKSSKNFENVDISIYASTVGALLDPLNLLPDEFNQKAKNREKAKESLVIPIVAAAAMIIAGAGLSGYSYYQKSEAQKALDKVNSDIAGLSYVVDVQKNYAEYYILNNEYETLNRMAYNENYNLRDFLHELEDLMPTNMVALSAYCDNLGVSFNIETATMEDAAMVISQLRNFDTISDIIVSGVEESDPSDSIPVVSFTITAMYSGPEEQAIADAAKQAELDSMRNILNAGTASEEPLV